MNLNSLKKNLKKRLDGVNRLVVLGIGSELKSDDGAGMLVATVIQAGYKKKKHTTKLKTLFGSTAPENFTGEIIKFKADHVIMIDCADMLKKPGTIGFIEPENVGGTTFSTHMLPIDIMAEYLSQSIKCTFTIIGIQPKSIDYGSTISPVVCKSVKDISSAILSSIK